MSDLTIACTTCTPAVTQVFDPMTGTRANQLISGDLFVIERCFVRDEIRFVQGGRLIFSPRVVDKTPQEIEEEKKRGVENPTRTKDVYEDSYYVICRRLTIIGGGQLGDNPDSDANKRKNVITWRGRIHSAAAGTSFVGPAANGPSFNGAWTDQGQGNDGMDGGNGTNGQKGNKGGDGLSAPKQVVVIALEVDVQPLSHLNIDWDGQDGGNGGKGQEAGKGGPGMNGRTGQSDTTWPGTGCDRQPGNGGNGGNGGDGGPGGDGGGGGNAGDIIVISTKENISTGPFVDGSVSYLNDGGAGGKGGGSGKGGKASQAFGQPGPKTSECSDASPGVGGVDGVPDPPPLPVDLDPNKGAPGPDGTGGIPASPQELQPGTCADLLPLPMTFDASGLQPNHICRGFSLPSSGDASVTGQNLAQAKSVTASLAGVTPSIKVSSTDVQLDLKFQVAGNSGVGNCNLIFKRDFGPDQTLTNALSIGKFEVLTITPNTGTKGNAVNVTITGNCFDASAAIQQVNVSGLGVNALNIVIVDEHTVQCVLDIATVTASGARDITVKTGPLVHTLINAFTIS